MSSTKRWMSEKMICGTMVLAMIRKRKRAWQTETSSLVLAAHNAEGGEFLRAMSLRARRAPLRDYSPRLVVYGFG